MKPSVSSRPQSRSATHRLGVATSAEPCVLGDWQLLGRLGEGNWSVVYAGRPRDIGWDGPADYAVKVAKSGTRPAGFAKSLLVREAQVGSEVSQPHLIAVLAAKLDGAQPHLVTPLIRGATLSRTLRGCDRLSTAFSLWVTRQIAEAVAALHAAGWLHADIKPSNIVVSANGHATLLDLGFSMRLGTAECAPGADIRGTLAYTAPEMISSSAEAGERCDIYSLGLTLYQMLTGRLPFKDQDTGPLAVAQLQHHVDSPRRFVPQLHPDVCRLLQAMLAKQPLRRPTALELIDWLAELEIATLDDRIA